MRAINIRCFVCNHRYHPARGHCPCCGAKMTQIGQSRSYSNVRSGRPMGRGEAMSYEKMLNMAIGDDDRPDNMSAAMK